MATKKKNKPFELPVYNLVGKLTERTVSLNPEVFGIKPNEKLVAQAVRVYLARRRNAHAKVKSRGEVRGSRRKIWAQKGTGRARHGNRYAPIFVGGGVAHGPRGNQNFNLRMPRKMKRLALFSVLSDFFQNQKILLVSGWQKLPLKTRQVEKKMALLLTAQKVAAKKVGLFIYAMEPGKRRGLRNLRQIQKKWELNSINPSKFNTYRILQCQFLIMSPETVGYLNELGAKR